MGRPKTYYPTYNKLAYALINYQDEYIKRMKAKTAVSGAQLTQIDALATALAAWAAEHPEYIEVR